MREFWGVLSTHIKRGIFSPAFIFCTVLCTIMMIFFVGSEYSIERYTKPGLYYFLNRADHSGSMYFVMMITAFPAATLFYDNWKSGYFKFVISRSGRTRCTFAINIAAGIIAAAVMILSYIFFTVFILL